MLLFIRKLLVKPVVLGLAAVVLGGGGYFVFLRDGGGIGPTLTVHRGDFREEVSVSGTVVAAEHADLGFAASGRIVGVYAKVGERVSAGALLAEIENGDLRAAVAEQTALLAALSSGTRPEQIAIDEAAVAQARLALGDALRSGYISADDAVHNRADQFFTNGRTSDARLSVIVPDLALASRIEAERVLLEPALASWSADIAASDPETAAPAAETRLGEVSAFLDDAAAGLAKVQPYAALPLATLQGYESSVATGRVNVANALSAQTAARTALISAEGALALARSGATREDLQAAEAKLASARAALEKTFVRAPFMGIVSRFDLSKGDLVSANVSNISIVSDGAFEIEAYIPELSINGVAVGDTATVTLDAYRSTAFPATVIGVDPGETIRNGVPTYKTVLVLATPDARIRSGMTANVSITTGVEHDAIAVPRGALISKGEQSFVTLVRAGARSSVPVTVGPLSALGFVEIRSGLAEGDVIELSPAP